MSKRIQYVSFRKIDQAGKEGALMMRIALAVNNFASGSYLLRHATDLKSDKKTEDMGYGLILFLLTGQAGYLYEAILLIKNGKNKDELTLKTAPNLERYLVSLSTASQQDYEKVCSLLENGSNNADFKKYVENLRNRISFHYDHGYRGTRTAPDTPVSEQAVIGLAKLGLSGPWILPERSSNENERVLNHRFGFADRVIDYAIYRKVWEINDDLKGKM